MMFHGNPIPAEEDPMVLWRIKSQANEDARQQFLDGYVPQIRELGLTIPDPKLRKHATTASGSTPSRTGSKLRAVVSGHGPASAERLAFRRLSRARTSSGSRASCSRRRRELFEVFRQERKGQRVRARGLGRCAGRARSPRSTRASSTGGAASPTRCGSCRATPCSEIDEFVDEFDLKYRRVDGYSIKARLRRHVSERATS